MMTEAKASLAEARAIVEAAIPPKHPIAVIRDRFDARLPELRTALPAHISPERFVRVIITAIQINPDLATCEWSSLWNAAMRCANDGLIPDGTEAALVPYKTKAQYIPMYQGMLKRFRNSGQFLDVDAAIVHEGDEFDYWQDETGRHFKHRPAFDNDDKPIKLVFATARTKDGGSFFKPLSPATINKHRNMSRATREDAPWKQWPEEMMLKTALRVLSKMLPKSSDLDVLMQRDEEALLGVEPKVVPAERLSTQAALDHFGREAVDTTREVLQRETQPSEPQDATDLEIRTEPETVPDPAGAAGTAGAAGEVTATPGMTSAASDDDARKLRAAFLAGQHARDAGIARKNPPGEYRNPKRTDECKAWWDGWDSIEPEGSAR